MALINHPHILTSGFMENGAGADGVEVGLPPGPAARPTAGARAWWHRRLLEGDRITGAAGADHHHDASDIYSPFVPIFGRTVNLVRIDPSLPSYLDAADALANPEQTIDMRSDLVADAIQRGHVMVVEDTESPRIFIGADTNGDGVFDDARAGDCIGPDDVVGDEITIRVRVVQPQAPRSTGHYNAVFRTADSRNLLVDNAWLKTKVRYHDGFKRKDQYEIDPDDPFTITFRLPFDASRRNFVWVQLNKDVIGPINDMEALTNPIYFGDWGDECATSVRL